MRTYVYDIENRLVSSAPVGGGATTASLKYDPLGRLYETGTSLNPNASTTRFLYDGDELVAEYNSSGTLLRRYVFGAMSSLGDDESYPSLRRAFCLIPVPRTVLRAAKRV